MEHRPSQDDIAPAWYRRGAYILIIAVVIVIVLYVAYMLLAPAPTTQTPTCIKTLYNNNPCG